MPRGVYVGTAVGILRAVAEDPRCLAWAATHPSELLADIRSHPTDTDREISLPFADTAVDPASPRISPPASGRRLSAP